jgi:hypothetical protein
MTSFKQFAANRANARKSTGPVTEKGKEHSRCNAVRHGLTAETVIGALEDSEDYRAFEAAITADYDAQSAVERELVLRLASLLWRLRRATAVETGLFDIEAKRPGNRNADRYSTAPLANCRCAVGPLRSRQGHGAVRTQRHNRSAAPHHLGRDCCGNGGLLFKTRGSTELRSRSTRPIRSNPVAASRSDSACA